ncbi:hypothetical protein SynBIOSU31_00916 [Synechococcus sp. BIOS-U3-1]|nr:hypothetical protein SynBIOSU31_00916 [Synechococcus sp. BIOS-U3-1]
MGQKVLGPAFLGKLCTTNQRESDLHERIRLNAEIGLKNQTHRR